MKLYIDTEFTDLIPYNKLISIALVDENGEYFYAELNDTYHLKDCSAFVKEHVLPVLKGGEFVMSENQCALKITKWIEERGTDCILACDNVSWDYPHLSNLINKTGLWPVNLDKERFYGLRMFKEKTEKIIKEHNFSLHNALDDAKTMMLSEKWVGVTG